MFGSTLSGLLDLGQEYQSLDAGLRWELLEVVTPFGIPLAIIAPRGDASKKEMIAVSALLDPHRFVPVLRQGIRAASTDTPEHPTISCTAR